MSDDSDYYGKGGMGEAYSNMRAAEKRDLARGGLLGGEAQWAPAGDLGLVRKERVLQTERTVLEELRHRRVTTGAKITRLKDELQAAEIEFERVGQALDALTPPAQAVEAEPAIPEGFTKWEGGECPVPVGTEVEVLWRNMLDNSIGLARHEHYEGMYAGGWAHDSRCDNIIAYRIISEPAADEADEQPREYISTLTGDPAIAPDGDEPPDFTIGASAKHADESAALAPLLPPEPPKPATPEELQERGLVDSEASWWARKLAKEPA